VKVKSGIFVVIFLLLISLIGCTNKQPVVSNVEDEKKMLVEEAIKLGEKSLNNNEYMHALSLFEIALSNDADNKEAALLKTMINQYITAQKQVEQLKIEEAKKTLEDISVAYNDYPIKKDINELKSRIEEKLKEKAMIENEINKIAALNEEDKYYEAYDLFVKLSQKNLSFSHEQKLNILSDEIKKGIANNYYTEKESKSLDGQFKEKLDKVEKSIKEDPELQKLHGGSTIDMQKAYDEELKRWRTALDEIMEVIKKTEGEKQIKKLNEVQTIWNLFIKKRADLVVDSYDGGSGGPVAYISSIASATKDRCYDLAELYGGTMNERVKLDPYEFQYWINNPSVGEKDKVLDSLWRAYIYLHAEEVAMKYEGTASEQLAYNTSLINDIKAHYYNRWSRPETFGHMK
jgi:hypothetical protein